MVGGLRLCHVEEQKVSYPAVVRRLQPGEVVALVDKFVAGHRRPELGERSCLRTVEGHVEDERRHVPIVARAAHGLDNHGVVSDGYLICATPRTGSTLLCGLLASTGVAGNPELYFRVRRSGEGWRCGIAGHYEYVEFVRRARITVRRRTVSSPRG